jgi:hypothetical protein
LDIVLSLLKKVLFNGEFVLDLKDIKIIAENMKGFIPSHDTVEYAFQELKNLIVYLLQKIKWCIKSTTIRL